MSQKEYFRRKDSEYGLWMDDIKAGKVIPILGEEIFADNNGRHLWDTLRRNAKNANYELADGFLVNSKTQGEFFQAQMNQMPHHIDMVKLLVNSLKFNFFINITSYDLAYQYLQSQRIYKDISNAINLGGFLKDARQVFHSLQHYKFLIFNLFDSRGVRSELDDFKIIRTEFEMNQSNKQKTLADFGVNAATTARQQLITRTLCRGFGDFHFVFLGCSVSQWALLTSVLKFINSAEQKVLFVNSTKFFDQKLNSLKGFNGAISQSQVLVGKGNPLIDFLNDVHMLGSNPNYKNQVVELFDRVKEDKHIRKEWMKIINNENIHQLSQ